MPIAPPPEATLDHPPMGLMDLLGRMRSLTDQAGFSGTLPAIWQCSDESQMIKKALFGYVFDCPSFDLGRVGALLDPTRLTTAGHHGHDIVILGGSHLGAHEEDGIGYVSRIHGKVSTCCGMLQRLLHEYRQVYRRAAQLVTVKREETGALIEIPYKYLFRKPAGDSARIQLHLEKLVEGDSVQEGNIGKIYRLHPEVTSRYHQAVTGLGAAAQPIGPLLDAQTFSFIKKVNHDSAEPMHMLESSVFPYMPEVVTAAYPHRRLCDITTWRQFHRLAAYLTDSFDSGDRNILVVAGLTLDHSVKYNTFVPQFGFWMEQGRALQARYFGPAELNSLLTAQPVYRPPQTFLEYAGVSRT
jgi:hypothetical protein